jgi:hypothetical protein
VPLKGFEAGEQRSLQRLRSPRDRVPPASSSCPCFPRESFVGQEGCHVQGYPASRGVWDAAVVLPRQTAGIGCAIAGLV